MVSYLRDLDLAWGLDELPDLSFSGVLSQRPQNLSDLFNLQTKCMNEDFMVINLQSIAKCQLRKICVSCILCVYRTYCIWYMYIHVPYVSWIYFSHCTVPEIYLSSAYGLSCKYCRSFQHSSQIGDAFISLRPEAEFTNVQLRFLGLILRVLRLEVSVWIS